MGWRGRTPEADASPRRRGRELRNRSLQLRVPVAANLKLGDFAMELRDRGVALRDQEGLDADQSGARKVPCTRRPVSQAFPLPPSRREESFSPLLLLVESVCPRTSGKGLMRSPLRLVLLAVALLAFQDAAAAGSARVVSFTPQGASRDVSQVAVTFSEPMIPFGDPRRAVEPFQIECAGQGTARWIDERSWVYDFVGTLPAGLRCRFDLQRGLKTLDGRAVVGRRSFSFSTGGPQVRRLHPFGSARITSDQMFAIQPDGPLDEASLLRHAYFTVQKIRDPVGLVLVEGKDREEVLGSFLDSKRWGDWIVVQARQRFPAESKVTLVWGKGIQTPSGVATTDRQTYSFSVAGPFAAKVRCRRERKKAHCVPITPIYLDFSDQVTWESASRIALVLERPTGEPVRVSARRVYPGDYDPWIDAISFRGPFEPNARYRIEYPPDLRDVQGRPLGKADPEARTDAYPPLAKFAASFGLIELQPEAALPVTLRGLEPEVSALLLGPAGAQGLPAQTVQLQNPTGVELLQWLRRLDRASYSKPLLSQTEPGVRRLAIPLAPPPPSGDSLVVGIPLPGPGLHLVEIQSRVLGERLLDPKKTMYVSAGALVTDLAVHLLWGQESSLVWVTSLATSQPVPGARVAAYDCRGDVRAEGMTDASGVARMDGLPGSVDNCEPEARGWSSYDSGLLVTATLGSDTGFVHSSWDRGIESWRFRVPQSWGDQPEVTAHTVLDRKLFRAGETVHMKHVLRQSNLTGFFFPGSELLPDRVRISHAGSGLEQTLPLEFAANGTALTEWQIPREARKGSYDLELLAPDGSAFGSAYTGSFRVEDFRLPFMRGTIKTPSEPQVVPSTVPIDVAVQYLAGGGASALPVTIRSEIGPMYVLPFEAEPALEGFRFGLGSVKTGVTRGSYGEAECEQDPCEEPTEPGLQKQELTLDQSGTARIEIPVETKERPQRLTVELEYPDPAGITQTTSRTVPLWPSARVVGLRVEPESGEPGEVRATAVVVDLAGKPIADAEVVIESFERRTYTHRRRLVGGFYAYSSAEETLRMGQLCAGRTDGIGLLACQGKVESLGSVILQATSIDEKGHAATTHEETWLSGDEDDWSEPSDDDRMDLIPDRLSYEPGDVARLRLQMPFRDATALVVVERRDVGKYQVVPVSSEDPFVEVPIEGSYAPNVFVSVLAVRGRVADVQPTGRVDLGRPAFRLGIRELTVGWHDNRLEVEVEPEEEVYRVRDKARVEIEVETASGAKLPPDAEAAVAVVDEALLSLLPNDSWNLLDEMMGRRSHGISFSSGQGLVIGRRHFGLKALPHGGGGGRRPTRELFDTLLLWSGRVPLDRKGRAVVEIPINDSLTSFRVAVVATAGAELFGTGEASFRTTQDVMVLPGVPPLVREGDVFPARFTLRNTTWWGLDITVAANVQGLPAPLAPITTRVGRGEARDVSFDVKVPAGVSALKWDVVVESNGKQLDRLKISQRVIPVLQVRTLQGTVAMLDPSFSLPIEPPIGAVPGQGGVEIALKPSLAHGLDGIEDYLRTYPYSCLEQQVSRAVGLRDPAAWQTVLDVLPVYLDGQGLAKFFPSMEQGSSSLTSYLLAISNEAGLSIPEGARKRMIEGLVGIVRGTIDERSFGGGADLTLRKLAALEALSRYAKVGPELLKSIAVAPSVWPTSALLDWIAILRRTPAIPRSKQQLADARRILQSRLILQGTTLKFSTQGSDGFTWLLTTPDVNAARILLDAVERRVEARQMARLVRGALSRQERGRWDSTMADAWNVVALGRFSKAYEQTPVSGEVHATLAGLSERATWRGSEPLEMRLPWPTGDALLELKQEGPGRPWAMIQARAAVPLREPLSSGFRITRTAVPLLQKTAGALSRGDLVKVTLEIDAQTDNSWVVVRDPIPAGAAILGSGLGGGSLVASSAGAGSGCPCGAYTERSFEAFTQYFSYVPQGRFDVEYVMVVNQDGTFQLPPTRVEAMYAPETFAEAPIAPIVVGP